MGKKEGDKACITLVMAHGAMGANEMDTELDRAIRKIAVAASDDPKGDWAEKWGVCFENATFLMQLDLECWCTNDSCKRCDGTIPNFWYKPTDFKVWWYKYIGRDMEIKGVVDINEMVMGCLNSLREVGDVE